MKSFIRKIVVWLELPLAAATEAIVWGPPDYSIISSLNLSHCKEGKTAMNLGQDPKSDLGGQGLNNCAAVTVFVGKDSGYTALLLT